MINGYASIYGHLGYNVHARKFFQALNGLTPVCLVPLYPNLINFKVEKEIRDMIQRQETIRLSDPAICIGYGDDFHRFNGAVLIGFTVFEYTRLSPAWTNLLKQMDQVWTPSTWGKQILIENGIDASTIAVVPEGIDPAIYKPRKPTTTAEKPFTFLSIGKWEERKGQKILLEAYARAFQGQHDVELHALWHNPLARGLSIEQEIHKLGLGPLPPIKLLDPLPSARRMAELYNSADCFVLPTRGEGWGLPIMEAMACGVPVITTRCSAITDYANDGNAFLINSTGVADVYDPIFLPEKGRRGTWADPDVDHLAELMRTVYEDRERAKAVAEKASQDIHSNWTWAKAAEKAYDTMASSGVI